MKIYSVYDPEFRAYGRVIEDDFSDILKVLATKPCPDGVIYVPSDADLEACPSYQAFIKDYYGNMPVQLGYCNGHNNALNCLEYHADSEVNLANEEFILLLGLRGEIIDGKFDTKNVKAFKVPAKVAVEVFATALHYAPCGVDGNGFRVLVALPRGTNTNSERSKREPMLWATNKWLLAHPESNEAKDGAYIGLVGENIKL